ncbi:MAG TPA: NAD(P)-binding protein [Burkholderiales bacterium]|nr:NAD(P)-binding protein [Burkholderiales bacterium]
MLRIAVVGGSLGGLTAALLLRDAGHDVAVFERSPVDLTGFGAGIVAHEVSMRYFVGRTRRPLDAFTVAVNVYCLLDASGALLYEEPVAYRFVSWGSLYRALLDEFGRERYFQGVAFETFQQDAHGVDVRFADGTAQRFDLLVLADGIQSTGRAQLFPGVEPVYSGYVAWRGTVEEGAIPTRALERLEGTLTYTLIPNSHVLVYPIPGTDGNVERGRRLWNFVWYRNVEAGADLDALLTDCDGVRHAVSLRPGRVQVRYVRELRAYARAQLPEAIADIIEATELPFLQVVMDVACPRMAVGRVCIIGDAPFAARPHAAAGTAKAAENAWTLAEALAMARDDWLPALATWSAHQTALGARLVERARDIGEGSQFRCDWRPGDPALRFGLYEPGDSSIWTRTTRSNPDWWAGRVQGA